MAETRLPISVCIIAANEARRIRGTLESVAGWASEIIVVLNHDVNDGTDKIAESFNAKVFRETWKGFVAQKNSAAEKCSQPWLLNLDADEVVSPELQKSITATVSRNNASHNAYEFPRCTFYCGRWIRHGDWYPDFIVRLWKRGTAQWTGRELHERLEVKGSIGKLHGDLLHYSTEDLNHVVRKTILYTDILAKEKYQSGRQPGLFTLWFRPLWRFIRGYFFRLGFLDGWQGLTVAWMTAFYTFLRYAKARELQIKKSPE